MPESEILSAAAQYGPLALLFGFVLWSGGRLAERALEVLREIERMRADAATARAEADRARAEADLEQALELRRQLAELGIVLRRVLQDLERAGGVNGDG